jgi:ribosomal protein S18 acetylase RimI-like enzyme
MGELSFKQINDNEVSIVASVLTSATQHKIKHDDDIWGSGGWSDDEVQGYMKESSIYLVRQDESVVGTVSLQWEDERAWGKQPPIAGYMHKLAINEGFHGQGLGEKIIEWALQQVADNGRQFLRLDCAPDNTSLCAYYEKQGFVLVETRKVPEFGDYTANLYQRPVSI